MTSRVLITGAASGIGQATALAFLKNGYAVHIADNSEQNVEAFRSKSPNISATCCDVSKEIDVERLFQDINNVLGGLDVLVNNAGIAGPTALVENVDTNGWRQTLAVNLDGTFFCTRKAVPLLKQNGGGCIINISSTAGLYGYPNRSPYATAKWGIIGLTKTLAMELGEQNIRVNAICPGSVEGERMDRVIAAEAKVRGCSTDEVRDDYTKGVSMRSFVKAENIADTILFLCSPQAAKISGQALSVDGHTETLR